MTPEQQGAFCKVCSKVVVDFSKMSDEEVIAYLEKKKEEKTCGRFKASQLSPYELKIDIRNIVTKGSFPKIFAASLFIFFSSLFVCKSDTGDNIVFNKLVADRIDTTSVTLVADTTLAPDITLPVIDDSSVLVTHQTGEVEMVVVQDTTPPVSLDSLIIDLPVMGLVAPMPPVREPEPIIMGKMVCPRPTETENEKINKKKQAEKKRKNDREIMGDVLF